MSILRFLVFAAISILVAAASASPAEATSLGTATEWGRTLERLFVVVSGALSMYYGFRLFTIVASSTGELSAKAGEWQLRLVRVGPGVFFAFFGAAIVIYALAQAPSVTLSNPASGTVVEIHGAIAGLGVDSESEVERISRSITTLKNFAGSAPVGEKEQTRLVKATQSLEIVQAKLVDAKFGEGAYAEWLQLSGIQGAPTSAFADAMKNTSVRTRFNSVDEFLTLEVE